MPSRWACLGLLLTTFLLAASPLLVRNLRRYGTPFYNVNSYLLFVDRFQDPKQLAREYSLREIADEYFSSHNGVLIVERQIRGSVWETFIIARMLGPSPLDDSRILIGLPLAAFMVIGGLTRPAARPLLLLVWLFVCWQFFAWYVPIAAGERFAVPLLPPACCLAACGWVRLLAALPLTKERATGLHILLGLVWCGGWLTATMLDSQLPLRFP